MHSSTMPRLKLRRPSLARKNSVIFHNDCDDNDGPDADGNNDKKDGRECSNTDVLDEATVDHSEASVLRWKVENLAAHLTLITQEIFQELQPHDLKSLKWYNARLKNEPESLRVNEITRRFNYDGQWTVKEILNCQVSLYICTFRIMRTSRETLLSREISIAGCIVCSRDNDVMRESSEYLSKFINLISLA